MSDLVERLRTRAENEREIQRNNEAVADALQAQLDAFNRKDGTHNNFAVRLGLEHRNCAKNDASFAQDWDEAADALEAAQAQIEAVRRETVEAAVSVIELRDEAIGNHVGAQVFLDRLNAEEQPDLVLWDLGRAYIKGIRALTEAKEDRT